MKKYKLYIAALLLLLCSGCAIKPDSMTLGVWHGREDYQEYGKGTSDGVSLDFTWEIE